MNSTFKIKFNIPFIYLKIIPTSCICFQTGTKAQIDEAMTTLEGAIKKGVLISEINRSCLVALKSECERLGKSFPHQIPQAVSEFVRFLCLLSIIYLISPVSFNSKFQVRDNSRSDTSSEGT